MINTWIVIGVLALAIVCTAVHFFVEPGLLDGITSSESTGASDF